MNICLYTETALPHLGGQERVVDALARQFVARGHGVVVLAPRRRGQRAQEDAFVPPYPVAWHPRLWSTRWLLHWYGYWLGRLHRRHRFDLIHCHSTYPSGYIAARCARLRGVRLVITSHGSDLDPRSLLARKPALRSRYAMAIQRADAVVALNRFTEGQFRAICPQLRCVARIDNGVDFERLAAAVARPECLDPVIRPGRYFLFLGRLSHRKGADLLLSAFAAMARESDIRLVIGGGGPRFERLRQRAADLAIEDRTHFLGWIGEGSVKTWLLQNSLCAVLPSLTSEAFPLVLLESFAAGRPVIGARIPGLEDLISPETGWLVTPQSVAELAAALRQSLHSPEVADAKGRAAQRGTTDSDWSKIAGRHLELYDSILRGGLADGRVSGCPSGANPENAAVA